MADDEDVDAAFRRLVADMEREQAAKETKPSRESMREVKHEARARRSRGRTRRSIGGRFRNVLIFAITAALLGGAAYLQLHRGAGLLPGDAAAAAPTDTGSAAAPSDSPSATPSDGATTDSGAGRDFPTPGHEEAAAPLGTPAAVPATGGAHRFMSSQAGGAAPVAYDPCRPLHYVVNTANEPAQGKALVADALAAITAASGLHFIDDGTTTETFVRDRESFLPQRYGDRWAPVLVVWPTGRQQPDFVGNAIGEAGSAYVRLDTGLKVYITGEAQFDSDWFQQVLAKPGGRVRAESVVLHEFGHLVGLDHVTDPTQVMFAMETPTARHFGAGDLAGLAQLGAGQCAPGI